MKLKSTLKKQRIISSLIIFLKIGLTYGQIAENKSDLIINNAAGSMLSTSDLLSAKIGLDNKSFKYNKVETILGFRLFHKSANFNFFFNYYNDFKRLDGVNPSSASSYHTMSFKCHLLGFNYAHKIKLNESNRLNIGISARVQKGDIVSYLRFNDTEYFIVPTDLLKLYVNTGIIYQYENLDLGISYTKSIKSNFDFILRYKSKPFGDFEMVNAVYSNSRTHFLKISRVYTLNNMLYLKDLRFGLAGDYIKFKNAFEEKDVASVFISPTLGYCFNKTIDLQCAFTILTINSSYLSRVFESQIRFIF